MTDRMFRSSVDPDLAIDPDEVGRLVEELFPEALGVWVYGSVATGSARRDSDIDIAILPDRLIDVVGRWERAQEVAWKLRRDVDLVDLTVAPPLLRFEVFADGRRLAARDPVACDRFEMTAVSQYQRLNEERREMFDEIARRGTVY